ncbi:MAG TPA: ATP-binding protein [Candidatus Saccharimonadia bacterium]
MFRSAAAKLTLSYLAIVMLVSGVFSVVLYNVSYGQIASTIEHQRGAINRLPLPPQLEQRRTQYNQYLDDELNSDQDRLVLRLLLLNAGMLLLGGAAAYLLARRTLQPIQEAMEIQGRFTGDASHELRTPLTAMRAEIEVALRHKDLPATEARDLLASNLEEIAKLESLSAGLLRLARTEKGLDPAAITKTPAADIINDAAERFAGAISERNINLEIKSGAGTLAGDRDSLVELFAILIDNAIKYSPDGTTITLASALAGQHIRFTVADQGAGIAATDLPYIFNRFYRADRSRARDKSVGGYGLGLSIAKRIVDLHHGAIAVDSTLGKGTTFTVKLPVRFTSQAPVSFMDYVHTASDNFNRAIRRVTARRAHKSPKP